MTAQEIFDAVCAHAKTMKQKSLSTVGCAYRGIGGNRCFVGTLIPDDEYVPAMEGRGVVALIDNCDYFPEYLEPHVELLDGLQRIHDMASRDQWPMRLARLATLHGLDSTKADIGKKWA